MGFKKSRRPQLDGGRRTMQPINHTVTTSTATRLTAPGDWIIGQPTGNKLWTLGAPKAGSRMSIFCDTRSTKDIAIQTKSSATTFNGSTNNKATVSTGLGGVQLDLVGLSTSVWQLTALRGAAFSTKSILTLAASTKVA